MTKIIDTVRETIRKHRLIGSGELALVAVSGGCDSVFLLRALHELMDELEIGLKVAHLNHMLRGDEADRDAELVKRLCHSLSVDCILESRDVQSFSRKNKLSLEQGARACRYAFLETTREKIGADKIVLGHTMDDQAETLLLRLFRGSGTTGLSSMLPERGLLVRPLLELRRNDIRDFLDASGFEYTDDPSNLDQRFRRNVIRHSVIPMLDSYLKTSVVPILARTASVLAEEDAYLEDIALSDLEEVARNVEPDLRLDCAPFMKLAKARQRRVLRAAIRMVKGELRDISSAHIDGLLELIISGSAGCRMDVPSLEAYKDYDSLILTRGKTESATQYEKPLEVPGVTVVEEAKLSFFSSIGNVECAELDYSHRNKAYFDLNGLTPPISVRNRRPGDRFIPFAACKPKKLKEVFIDDKVSRRLRDLTAIVVDSEGILWIPGGRRSDRAPVTAATERILCIEARKSVD